MAWKESAESHYRKLITVDPSNEPDNRDRPEPALISWLARIIAGFVRFGRWIKDRVRRLFGKKRGRYAPLVDVPSAAAALSPRVINPAAKIPASESAAPAPFINIPLEEEYQPRAETTETSEPGSAKPLPFKKSAEFQASETGAQMDHEMIVRIQARKTSPLAIRHLRAKVWTAQRKLARLHRRFPLWLVATFYLLCAGSVSLLISRPFLSPPKVVTTPIPHRSEAPQNDPRRLLGEIAQLISLKKYDEAQKQLEALRILWPADPRVCQIEGALLAGRKDYAGARKAFEKALAMQPGAKSVLFNLAEVDFVSGNYAAAEDGYKKLTGVWPKNGMLLFRLYLCERMQKHQQEAAEIASSPGLIPESVDWLYVQAAGNILDGKKSMGQQYLDKARLVYPEDGKVYELTLRRMKLID